VFYFFFTDLDAVAGVLEAAGVDVARWVILRMRSAAR
jgi:hypothetical protein